MLPRPPLNGPINSPNVFLTQLISRDRLAGEGRRLMRNTCSWPAVTSLARHPRSRPSPARSHAAPLTSAAIIDINCRTRARRYEPLRSIERGGTYRFYATRSDDWQENASLVTVTILGSDFIHCREFLKDNCKIAFIYLNLWASMRLKTILTHRLPRSSSQISNQ